MRLKRTQLRIVWHDAPQLCAAPPFLLALVEDILQTFKIAASLRKTSIFVRGLGHHYIESHCLTHYFLGVGVAPINLISHQVLVCARRGIVLPANRKVNAHKNALVYGNHVIEVEHCDELSLGIVHLCEIARPFRPEARPTSRYRRLLQGRERTLCPCGTSAVVPRRISFPLEQWRVAKRDPPLESFPLTVGSTAFCEHARTITV